MNIRNLLIFFCLFLHPACLFANERIALVIGNTDYEISPLRTAVNDATEMAKALSETGFQVSLKLNTSQPEMEAAVQEFGQSIQAGAIGLFYYAGHAVQHRGENYLIPINAISSISAPEHLRYKTVPLGYILGVVNQSASDLNVVILDSCRNSPFKSFSRDLTRGITRMPSSEGTLIAYSTAPGKVALDGDGDDIHSPYTKHLLKHIKKPGLTIEQVLKKVRASVKKETNGQQTPWYEASIDGDFYFIEGKKKGIADNEPRKVIKVVTVDPKETINIPRQEKQEAKKKIISSVKEFAYLDLDSVKKGKRLSVSQVRELVSGNTLSPTTGAYKGAKIYLHTDGRAYYYKKTSDGKVTEGVSSWVFSGSRICSDLHPLGTNADLSEREVCYRFYKHEEQEFKLKIVHIKLSSHWEKQPIGKSFQTKIIKGRQLQ